MGTSIEAQPADAVSRRSALVSLLDGHLKTARVMYSDYLTKYPGDKLAEYELGCVQAVTLPLAKAEEAVKRLVKESLGSIESSRVILAKVYLQVRRGPTEDIEGQLLDAIENDPSFALAHLSLGRHLLWTKGEIERARRHLGVAAALAPEALGPKLDLVGLEAQVGDFRKAARKGFRLLREHPFSAKVWLASLSAGILSTPSKGRFLLFGLAITLFFKYVGLLILISWIAFSILSLIGLRRVSSALAVFPAVFLAALLVAYLARTIMWGRFFP